MSHEFEKCSNCGAPIETSADGRSVQCPYCGAAESRAVDPARLAASLQAEARSVLQLFESLAERLVREFPELTRVEKSGGFFSAKRVDAFEVALDRFVFRMRRSGGGVTAERAEIVRGITVKTEPLAPDAWVQGLCEALSTLAGSSARAFEALKRIGAG